MKKEDLSVVALLFEAIDLILLVAYVGLQIYYGIFYHIPIQKYAVNILVLVIIYIGLSILSNYPEQLNRIPAYRCVGDVRKYSLRMIRIMKFVFIAGLLVPSVCDAFGYGIRDNYSVIFIVIAALDAIYYEYRILTILRNEKN